ncbi:MAG: helix-turn-helix domain-containing protein [Chloroflexota bacterium]
MTALPKAGGEWLALGRASEIVGVDPDTLRRWADEGRIDVYHTPGGHRRFQRSSLERLIVRGSRERSTLDSLGATPERLTDAYRRTYLSRDGLTPNPYAAVREEDREMFRRNGRLLVDALVGFLNDREHESSSASLQDATELSSTLGARLAASGTSLTESVALFVAARRPFLGELGTLAKRRRLDSRQVAQLFDEASRALDACLLAFIDGHRDTSALE